jgi:hypothetical protein
MPIADDWSINYATKQIYHANWKDEINGTSSSVAEIQTALCLLASGITSGDYFLLWSAKDETPYYVWYNKASGGGDPAPVGKTAIPVLIGATDTAIQVATATVAAIGAANFSKDFTAANGGTATVTITNKSKGSCTNAVDVNAGFTHAVTVSGVGETVFSVNALYSYLQDTFDELGQMDDKVPMSAQTPTDYTLINEWFIDEVSIKYLTGGALKSDGWLRATGTNTGIVQIVYASGSPAASDFGLPIVEETDLDAGTVLFIDATRKIIWIRPDSSAIGNAFDSTGAHNVDITGGTQNIPRTAAAATSGENLWANVYTLGTIQSSPYPQIYVFQNGSSISEWSTLSNWDRGQIDVLVRVKEMGTEIDGANITVFARQGGNSYDHFSIDLTSGGRNAVPLSTATDLNYTSGDYYLMYKTEASGPFNVGEVIAQTDSGYDFTAGGWSAQIVAVTDDGTTGTLKLTNVKGTPANNHYFKAYSSTASGCTAQVNGSLGDTYTTYTAEGGTPPGVGTTMVGGTSTARRILRGVQDDGSTGKLVLQVDTTITGTSRNVYYKNFTTGEQIQQSGTPANYYTNTTASSTTIVSGWDDITIAFVNGTATYSSISAQFTYGEKVTFTGGTAIVLYQSTTTGAGTITLGNSTITAITGLTITGAISGRTAVLTSNLTSAHTLTKNFTQQSPFPYDIIINAGDIYNAGRTMANVYEYLKFITQENSTFSMYTVVSSVITILDGEEYIQAYTAYTPVKSAPFGTFAGGTLFGAQGVWIEGLAASQSYQFIDSNGTGRQPYASITISVSSVVSGDRITVFVTSASLVNKNMYQSHTSSNTLGATAIVTDGSPAIASDTPDSGVIRVVDVSAGTEHRFRYASWTGSTFTLTGSFPTGTATTADVTGRILIDSGASFVSGAVVKPGDLIRNTSDGAWGHVITVDSNTQITHTPLVGGTGNDWVISDAYSFNNLPVVYTASDTLYVPYIDETATTTSVSKTVLYDTVNGNKDVLVRVRKKGILPFETSGTVTTSGLSVAAIRTTDSIVT